VDYPDRPEGDLYCRTSQDSPFNVPRGSEELSLPDGAGKRAASVKLCESDQHYVPLNDGYNWKGDPNATLSGQTSRSFRPHRVLPRCWDWRSREYDPTTGTYVGPDGQTYTQTDLAKGAGRRRRCSPMLLPPG
jgi:phospholipid/cholesterol/gamma-HCH transport system substrate-binding protein